MYFLKGIFGNWTGRRATDLQILKSNWLKGIRSKSLIGCEGVKVRRLVKEEASGLDRLVKSY